MALRQVFDSKDAAPEWLRNLLTEDGGKFVFEAELPTETAGLKTALQKEREQREAFEKQLKGFEGVDPEEARRLKEQFEKLETEKLRSKGDWETREKQLQERLAADLTRREQQYQSELTKRDENEQKLRRALERSLVEAEATAAIAAAKGSTELLLPHVMRQVRVVEEGGEFVARVFDGKNNPRIVDIKGTPFTIKDLVSELRSNEVFGRAFEATGVGGSGAQQTTGVPAGTVRLTREQARDTQTYRAAKAEAAKSGGEVQIID